MIKLIKNVLLSLKMKYINLSHVNSVILVHNIEMYHLSNHIKNVTILSHS